MIQWTLPQKSCRFAQNLASQKPGIAAIDLSIIHHKK
jgi:hypothetical protein